MWVVNYCIFGHGQVAFVATIVSFTQPFIFLNSVYRIYFERSNILKKIGFRHFLFSQFATGTTQNLSTLYLYVVLPM
jgi:hypothetical protein